MNASKTDPLDLKEHLRSCVNFFCPQDPQASSSLPRKALQTEDLMGHGSFPKFVLG